MENADVFGSSTAPLTWHDFLERMRHPSAVDFVKSIKSFIVSFSNNPPDPEKDSSAVQEFLSNMEGAFRAHLLWDGCSEEELESAGEGLEKYVMTRLFTRLFASLPEDVKYDEQLSEKLALLQQFIQPEDLDIKPTFQNETSWLLAQKELQKINTYKAPRDKLVCILNCCKVINNSLLNASIASNENPPGADEFLPVLIYVTIKANPPQLHSNLLYIQRYRSQSRLVSEAAYFFTNMLSTESFVANIDAKSLSMDETEFENNMETARALLSGLSTGTLYESNRDGGHVLREESIELKPQTLNSMNERTISDPKIHHHFPTHPSEHKIVNMEDMDVKDQLSVMEKLSNSDLEKRGATDLGKEDHLSRAFSEYQYLYAQVGDLIVNDVEDLLNCYKQLVFKYVSLSKGLGVATSSFPEPISQTETQSPAETEEDMSNGREKQ
ncbi:vacuolar protein sorting-associated protein 9A-like [Telopea speciosissima]|uniref:vacuolar protein sorting-associated protein 9A-like n=1 Tax=Telopea speciosissima TaxID=54955 RepID=UPI001CC4DFED|nr:vacuolar protein sorting-associated protein 9A-like [Telopea speciosissima]